MTVLDSKLLKPLMGFVEQQESRRLDRYTLSISSKTHGMEVSQMCYNLGTIHHSGWVSPHHWWAVLSNVGQTLEGQECRDGEESARDLPLAMWHGDRGEYCYRPSSSCTREACYHRSGGRSCPGDPAAKTDLLGGRVAGPQAAVGGHRAFGS